MKLLLPILLLLFLFSCADDPASLILVQEDEFCDKIHRNDSLSIEAELAYYKEQLENQTGAYVLEDGGSALVTRAWLCEYAEKSIDIQYFIFSTDNVGLIACDYLVRAADRGVKVRIIVDDIMVDAGLHEILMMDSHENIDIKIYNPGTNLGKNVIQKIGKFSFDFEGANQRMHNKTFIVDGKVVITGGRNVADEYFDYDHAYNFRDRDVLFMGTAVEQATGSFDEFWEDKLCLDVNRLSHEEDASLADPEPFDMLHEYACNPENFWPEVRERIEQLPTAFRQMRMNRSITWLDTLQFISDPPGKNPTNTLTGGGVTTDSLINLVIRAQHSIDIQTPYLITTDLGKNLFAEAVIRGVKVRILTNSLASTDNVEAFSGYQRDRAELLATGVEIYEFKPDAQIRKDMMTGELHADSTRLPIFGLHAKSMVVDNHITVIGTFNLDPRSANLNTECIAVLYSDDIAAKVNEQMEQEFEGPNAWRITTEFNPDHTVDLDKRLKTWTRKVVPKGVL